MRTNPSPFSGASMSDDIIIRRCSAPGCGGLAQSKCGRCGVVWYCDKGCQKKHYQEHKQPCKAHAVADRDFELGRAHMVVGNLGGAAACFECAAALGHADATFHFGDVLMFGAGVSMDKQRAVGLWKIAAAAGHAGAMQALLWGRGMCDCLVVCTCNPGAA